MNRLTALAVLGFSITLAVLIGQRMSDQAMAVIVGSVIGVAASMPMSALVLWLTFRSRDGTTHAASYARSDHAPREEPRMIVIQPQPYGAPQYAPTPPAAYLNPPPAMSAYGRPLREFKIVGQEDIDDESRHALV
jgi:hypothetical protein